MRRDICLVFPVDVARLYNAYLAAATNNRFRRECRQEPYHTLTFGLNFSMKYNFNGGACTLRFIPVNGGSAINMRFSLAQLAGARYEKYAKDLTEEVIAMLGVAPVRADIDVEVFMAPQNRVESNTNTIYAAPSPNMQRGKFCTRCGQQLSTDARFCSSCGNKV